MSALQNSNHVFSFLRIKRVTRAWLGLGLKSMNSGFLLYRLTFGKSFNLSSTQSCHQKRKKGVIIVPTLHELIKHFESSINGCDYCHYYYTGQSKGRKGDGSAQIFDLLRFFKKASLQIVYFPSFNSANTLFSSFKQRFILAFTTSLILNYRAVGLMVLFLSDTAHFCVCVRSPRLESRCELDAEPPWWVPIPALANSFPSSVKVDVTESAHSFNEHLLSIFCCCAVLQDTGQLGR